MPQKNDFIARRGRRWFLSVAGGSLGLAYLLQRGIGRAEGVAAPKRLMILHRPDGTVREDWLPGGQRGKILEPFAPVWSYAVALKGMDLKPGNNSNGADPHGKGLTTIMTGAHLSTKTPQGSDDGKWNTAPSLDQVWSRDSAVFNGTPVANLAIGANGVMDNLQEPQNRTLSFAGPEQPIYPVISPYDVYKRVFGDTILPGDGDAKAKALARLRLRRETVLAQVALDLGRVKQQFPASFRADLEAHEAAIRELELQLDRVPASGPGCSPPVLPPGLAVNDTNNLKALQIAEAQFAIVQAAFACDFTRMVTFMWGTGASALSFPEFGIGNHHAASHDDNAKAALSKADEWFSTHTAPFIQNLMKTPDASGGNLLDNTLVWYINECSVGVTHDETDMPFVLFGGDGVGLKSRGRVADVAGTTSNDIWLSIAPQFGMPGLTSFETAYTGPIPGLFS